MLWFSSSPNSLVRKAACSLSLLALLGSNGVGAQLNNDTSPTSQFKSVSLRSRMVLHEVNVKSTLAEGEKSFGAYMLTFPSFPATRPSRPNNRLLHPQTRTGNAWIYLPCTLPKPRPRPIHIRQLWSTCVVRRRVLRAQDGAYTASMSVQRGGPPVLFPG